MNDNSVPVLFKIARWVLGTVVVIFGITPQSGCSSGYENNNGAITLDGKEIANKDFIVLSDVFGKDLVAVYYKGKSIQDADLASFEALDAHYAKDKNKAYYCDEYREGQNYYLTKKQTILEIASAIPSSFVSLGDGYAKDGGHAYFLGTGFVAKDISSFKPLDSNFSTDDLQAYLNGKPIKGSDGKSFELLDEFYSKDKGHVYYLEATGPEKHRVTILPCDATHFTILDHPYSKDNSAVFYAGKAIAGADPASFHVLGNGYSKDRVAVYFEAKRIPAADAATFELYKDNETGVVVFNYAKDKASVFVDDKKVVGADVGSFKILTLGYAMDHTHVFYKATVVEHADIATFKTYEHVHDEEDAEDVHGKYLAGKRVPSNDGSGQ